jgi:hypothetical protein
MRCCWTHAVSIVAVPTPQQGNVGACSTSLSTVSPPSTNHMISFCLNFELLELLVLTDRSLTVPHCRPHGNLYSILPEYEGRLRLRNVENWWAVGCEEEEEWEWAKKGEEAAVASDAPVT